MRNQNQITHAIIIRMFYQPEHPHWSWRLAFFESMMLPRLLKQSDKNFQIWVRCHPEHEEALQNLGVKTYQKELPRFNIQTRVDCDDLVGREFVAHIHREVNRRRKNPLLISFQPYKLDLYTLTRYRMGQRYDANRASPFLSLYQPRIDGDDYRHIYQFNHGGFKREFGRPIQLVTLPEGDCDMVIHDGNKLNRIGRGDRAYALQISKS